MPRISIVFEDDREWFQPDDPELRSFNVYLTGGLPANLTQAELDELSPAEYWARISYQKIVKLLKQSGLIDFKQ